MKKFEAFFEKVFEKKMRILKQCRKTIKGRPLGLFETSVCCKISKNLKGDPLATKIFEKKSHSAEKIQRRDPVVPSGFVSFVKN